MHKQNAANGVRVVHGLDAHERAAAVARLEQIAIELTFPKLTQSQTAALELERIKLQHALAQDAFNDHSLDATPS
jgi:hypothetical protein